MNRRTFLQASGAAILASQLPSIADKALGTPPADNVLPPGDYVGYVTLPPVQRRVIFVTAYHPDEVAVTVGPPEAGTLVTSPDGKQLFAVVRKLDVDVISQVSGHYDTHHYGDAFGTTYWGHVVLVEAVAPGASYRTCEIRRIVTPDTGYTHVCEDFRTEQLGADPNGAAFALDALEPYWTPDVTVSAYRLDQISRRPA